MATLRARIQAFEQNSSGDDNRRTGLAEQFVAAERPEPRPRPCLQGQPAKSVPPVIAPKPKNLSPTPKPSCKEFWEGEDQSAETTEAPPAEPNLDPAAEPSDPAAAKSQPQPCRTTEKTPITPKPQPAAETPSPSNPVPAPRPPPPKTTPSLPNPKPPPRPAVAPRASLGSPHQDRSSAEPAVTQPGEFVAAPSCPLQDDYSVYKTHLFMFSVLFHGFSFSLFTLSLQTQNG